MTTWEAIQPTLIDVMRARGAVPLGYADMAAGLPGSVRERRRGAQACARENPGQTRYRGLSI